MIKVLKWGGLRLASAALALVAIAAWSGSPVSAQVGADGQESFRPPRGAMIAPGTPPDLTLLYTGDVIGYLDPCG